MMMIAQAFEAFLMELSDNHDMPSIPFETFRLLIKEITDRYNCINGLKSPNHSYIRKCINYIQGIDATTDYQEDLDILFGVLNFHFRRSQMKGTTQMLDDVWSTAVIQTPFRPALDWIEEYCTDLPLLNGEILIELFRKSLLSTREKLSSS